MKSDHAATAKMCRHRVKYSEALGHLVRGHVLRQRGEAPQVREEDGDLPALAGEALRVALDPRGDVGADVAAEGVAQPPPREDVGADSQERGDADGQKKVHPVAAAAERHIARRHAQAERTREADEGAPERPHRT